MYDQNGIWTQDGCGTNNRQLPTVQFVQGQPEPYCPAPGAEVVATQSQGRLYKNPNTTCRLEFDDIVGNTTLQSLIVIGNDSCFTDAELRTIFGVTDETVIVVRPAENCEIFEHQIVEGAITFTIDSADAAAADAQFARNAQQYFFGLINRQSGDCGAFKVTRAFRCAPCENGELIQAFGGEHCSPVVAGPQQLFGLIVGAGVTLSDLVLCPCAYSVPTVVRCVAPPTCPPPPPAPPVATYPGQNGAPVVNPQQVVPFNR